ncbi:SNF2 N-terminal domain family protein [Aspergillus niger]|uniref:SNF2 N-terminal domain family protein n=1 Tax=Aspergillus niger TaxID=5061 RepID=A0A505IBR3_ASPNG|nr:SNF2 N-terminal domain family protein [Aspergillus niger]
MDASTSSKFHYFGSPYALKTFDSGKRWTRKPSGRGQILSDYSLAVGRSDENEALIRIRLDAIFLTTLAARKRLELDSLATNLRQHHEELAAIGIIPGMVRSRSLKFWQRHGIWKLWRIWTEEKTKGAILADSVGLGKIIEGLESILTQVTRHKRQQMQAGSRALELRKPSKKLNMLVYFGDNRSRWRTVPCAWGFEIVDESDDLIRPTMDDFDRLDKVEKWLDTPEYQIDNHVEACSQNAGQSDGTRGLKITHNWP